jgi:hypothetical protein
MKYFMILSPKKIALVIVLAFFQVLPPVAFAKSPVKMKDFTGTIDLESDAPNPFTLEGTASHLGQFTARGEVTFVPGAEEGTLVGGGVVVFTAANGDRLVGNVAWNVESASGDFRTSSIHFSWADSVEFGNGTIAENTGRFVEDRPPGLVLIAIIAVVIGLLRPAVQ